MFLFVVANLLYHTWGLLSSIFWGSHHFSTYSFSHPDPGGGYGFRHFVVLHALCEVRRLPDFRFRRDVDAAEEPVGAEHRRCLCRLGVQPEFHVLYGFPYGCHDDSLLQWRTGRAKPGRKLSRLSRAAAGCLGSWRYFPWLTEEKNSI